MLPVANLSGETMKKMFGMIATLVVAAGIMSTSALAASDGKKLTGKKGAPCNVQECRRVFEDAGMTCNNLKPKPSQGEFGQRCDCDCMDPGGARKIKK